jgi:hypothetical protein
MRACGGVASDNAQVTLGGKNMAYNGPDWARLRQMEYDQYQAALLVFQEQQDRKDIVERARKQRHQHLHREELRLFESALRLYKFAKAHPELRDLWIDALRLLIRFAKAHPELHDLAESARHLLRQSQRGADSPDSQTSGYYSAQVFHPPTIKVRCLNCKQENKVIEANAFGRPGPRCSQCEFEMRIRPPRQE